MKTIETKDLVVGYGKKRVVEDINFSLEEGEILTILGPNGSGKSTILKTLINQIDKIKGNIKILGKNQDSLSTKEMAKSISVVLTERPRPELMTVYDLVSTGRYPHTNYFGKLTKEDKIKIDEAIELVNGEELKDKEIPELSDGERQRVMIARAICQESKIMILDEPTSYLDIRYKIELLDILKRLALEKEKTIIMSLHEIELASKIAHTVMLVHNNEIFRYGRPENVIDDKNIEKAYDIRCGRFDSTMGSIELPRSRKDSNIFIIGGNGKATPLYRALNKEDMNFYSGVIFENDLDYSISKNLGLEIVSEKPFLEISDTAIEKGKKLIDKVDFLIYSGEDFLGINSRNSELLKYGVEKDKKILSMEDFSLEEIIETIKNE